MIHIGTSGWKYPSWRGTFYPQVLLKQLELAFVSRQLNSLEIQSTFTQQRAPSDFELWHKQTPEDFMFSVQAPKKITQILKLEHCQTQVSDFFASGVLLLQEKLGPIVWRFAPSLTYSEQPLFLKKVEKFLELLPKDTHQAAQIARLHSTDLDAYTDSGTKKPIHHVFDLPHVSFLNQDFQALMKAHQVSLAAQNTKDTTNSKIFYTRLDACTPEWVRHIQKQQKEAFVYVKAPQQALKLSQKI